MERTWTNVGTQFLTGPFQVEPDDDRELQNSSIEVIREKIAGMIERLNWKTIPCDLPMMPGENIKAAIKELRIPKVSKVAISHELAPYGLEGIEGHYKDGMARVYLIDHGDALTVVCSDFYKKEVAQNVSM